MRLRATRLPSPTMTEHAMRRTGGTSASISPSYGGSVVLRKGEMLKRIVATRRSDPSDPEKRLGSDYRGVPAPLTSGCHREPRGVVRSRTERRERDRAGSFPSSDRRRTPTVSGLKAQRFVLPLRRLKRH